MELLRLTWSCHDVAMRCARFDAKRNKRRMKVVREDGEDEFGPYRFRILPADVEEQCS